MVLFAQDESYFGSVPILLVRDPLGKAAIQPLLVVLGAATYRVGVALIGHVLGGPAIGIQVGGILRLLLIRVV